MGEDSLTEAGNRYMTIFVILATRYVMIFLHKEKSEWPEILLQAFAQAGEIPKTLRTDQAPEYNCEKTKEIYRKNHILKQSTNAYQQFGNGPSEKMVDTVGQGMRTALLDANLPQRYWGYAAINCVDAYNHLPHASLDMKTPWEMQKGTIPDVSMFRPFGCRATVFVGEKKKELAHHKLAPRGVACIYLGLGFSRGYKGWMCFDPNTGKLYCSRNVVFDETFMPARTHDQRVLGHYDTTPRQRFPTLIHGSFEKAEDAYNDINQLPLIQTLDMIDNLELIDKESFKGPPGGTPFLMVAREEFFRA